MRNSRVLCSRSNMTCSNYRKIIFCYIFKIVRCQKDDKAVTAGRGKMGDGARISGKIEGLNQLYRLLIVSCRMRRKRLIRPKDRANSIYCNSPSRPDKRSAQAILHLSPVSKESFDSLSIKCYYPPKYALLTASFASSASRYRRALHDRFPARSRDPPALRLVGVLLDKEDGHPLLAQLLMVSKICWMIIGASPSDGSSTVANAGYSSKRDQSPASAVHARHSARSLNTALMQTRKQFMTHFMRSWNWSRSAKKPPIASSLPPSSARRRDALPGQSLPFAHDFRRLPVGNVFIIKHNSPLVARGSPHNVPSKVVFPARSRQ